MTTRFSSDVILPKLKAAYNRPHAHLHDMLAIDWWPAIGGTGKMPGLHTKQMNDVMLFTLAINGQPTAGLSPMQLWQAYWLWVTLDVVTPNDPDPPPPPPPPPTATFTGGMQNRSPYGTSFADLDLMKRNGAKHVRIPIDMSAVLQNTTVTDATLAGIHLSPSNIGDSIVYAYAIGLKVMCTLTYSPAVWGTQYHEIPKTANQITGWARGAVRMLRQYGGIVDSWEIWNEINHGPFNYAPTMATIKAFYKAVLLAMRAEAACTIISSGCASATSYTAEWVDRWDHETTPVTASGATASTGNGGGSISGATYMDGMFGATGVVTGHGENGNNYFDHYGIHGYCGTFSPTFVHRGIQTYHAFNDVPAAGTSPYNYYDDIIVAREGATTKKIWQTEGGFFGGCTIPGSVFTEGDAGNAMLVAGLQWKDYQTALKAGPYFYFENYDQAVYGASTNRYGASTTSEDYLGMYSVDTGGVHHAKTQLTWWRWLCDVPTTGP